MDPKCHCLPVTWLLGVAWLVLSIPAGCTAADAPAVQQPAHNTQSDAAERHPVETALLNGSGVQYGVYAELLALLSNEGCTPLLSRQVDLGADDPQAALANYRRLIELTDRMTVAEVEFRETAALLSDQTGLPLPGTTAPPDAVGWKLRFFSLLPVMQTGLLQSDLLHAGWKFWKWGENARRTARATVLGVAFADAEKHRLQEPEQAMMRRRIYEVARTRYADQGEIGNSEREFFENLRDGKLDHISQRLHADMSQDGSSEGMAYMTVAGMQGKRPIDIVYEEGCRGLAAGVDLYVAAGKAAVAGGLGPEAGEKFLEGYDKGVEIVEKIQEIESKAEELGDAVRDPIGYMQEKVPQVLQERAVELLKEKTGLSDEVIEECTDQLGEAVQQVVQNIEVSRRIDEAYEKDRFLAELAKERGDQPAADDSVPKVPAEAVRLRRITEQVHETMAAEGWNLGVVEIDLQPAADAASDTARASLDSVVAWWNDAHAGAARLTILPTAVASGTAIALPVGAQTELVELADSGAIHRLTDRPVAVSREGVTQVAIEPPPVESPPSRVVVGDRDVPGPQRPVPGPAGVASSQTETAKHKASLQMDDLGSIVRRPGQAIGGDLLNVRPAEIVERMQNYKTGGQKIAFLTDDFHGFVPNKGQSSEFDFDKPARLYVPGNHFKVVEQGTVRVWYDRNQNGRQDADEPWRQEPYWIAYGVTEGATFGSWSLDRKTGYCRTTMVGLQAPLKPSQTEYGGSRWDARSIGLGAADLAYCGIQTFTSKAPDGTVHHSDSARAAAAYGPFHAWANVSVHAQCGWLPVTHESPDYSPSDYIADWDELDRRIAFYKTGREKVACQIVENMLETARPYVEFSRARFHMTAEHLVPERLPGFAPTGGSKDDREWMALDSWTAFEKREQLQIGTGTFTRLESYSIHIWSSEPSVGGSESWHDAMRKADARGSALTGRWQAIPAAIPESRKLVAGRDASKPWNPKGSNAPGPLYYTLQERIHFALDNCHVSISATGFRLASPNLRTAEIAQQVADTIRRSRGRNPARRE